MFYSEFIKVIRSDFTKVCTSKIGRQTAQRATRKKVARIMS